MPLKKSVSGHEPGIHSICGVPGKLIIRARKFSRIIRSSLLLPIFLFSPMIYGQENDTVRVKAIDGTVHSKFLDKQSGQEKELKILFSEGVVKEMEVDGKPLPEKDWGTYQTTVDGIKQDYEESQRSLGDAEVELEKAEREMQRARSDMSEDNAHLALDVVESALAEAKRSIAELNELHGEDIRRGIEEARREVGRAMEQFRREDLPEIHKDIQEALKTVNDALNDLDESHGVTHAHSDNGHVKDKDSGNKAQQNNGQKTQSMESTLEQLEKK